MKRYLGCICGIALLLTVPAAAAELNSPIQGQAVQGQLQGYRNLGERAGRAGDQHGQVLTLDPRVVYQFQVRSYYYSPAVEVWDEREALAQSVPLTPYQDGRGTVYISEIAFRPWRHGQHYLRVRPGGSGRAVSPEYVVAVYGYVVDDPPPQPPSPPTPPQPREPVPEPPPRPQACRCPDGFEHWYGTVCVGRDHPATAECQ